jgi:hypothetical protein
MSCDITKGKALLECKDAVSGLKAIYLSNFDTYEFVAGTGPGASTQEITDITGSTASEWFKYELKNSGNTFQQDITSSRDNGTTFFTQTLNFVLTKLSSEMEFQVKMMAWGRPQIVVEANSGTFFLLGREHGCEISGNSQVQGTMDSLNGYTLTAIAMEKDPIFYLQAGAISDLLALVSTNNI